MYVLSYIWEKINKVIADIKVNLPLTKGCKKCKCSDTVESATDWCVFYDFTEDSS